jgi:gliding motility-associated transport system permease protein
MKPSNLAAIIQKEWRHYFGSPIAYVAFSVWVFLFGLFFSAAMEFFLRASMPSQGMEFGGGMKLSMNESLIGPVLRNMAVVVLFVVPFLTMRLIAEEKRQGTIELLATAPLTNAEIIGGKFLAALGLFGLMILAGLVNVALIWTYAPNPPEWKPVLTGAACLLLLGGTFISLGLFISSLTRNQVVAAIVTFGLALALWVVSWFDEPTAGPLTKAFVYTGVLGHVEDMMKGVLDLKHLVYYLSFIGFGLFLTYQSMESQRWRA